MSSGIDSPSNANLDNFTQPINVSRNRSNSVTGDNNRTLTGLRQEINFLPSQPRGRELSITSPPSQDYSLSTLSPLNTPNNPLLTRLMY